MFWFLLLAIILGIEAFTLLLVVLMIFILKKGGQEAFLNYWYNFCVNTSQSFNTTILLGAPDESTSSRIGKIIEYFNLNNIANKTRLGRHFVNSKELDEGSNSTFGRKERV